MRSQTKNKILTLILLFTLCLSFLTQTAYSITYHLPKDAIIRNGLNVHFGDYWIYAVSGTDIKITSWFESGWTNYTVYGSGTQQLYNGSKPSSVYLDGANKTEGDGWSYSSGTVTVTGATASASLLWGTSSSPPTTYEDFTTYTEVDPNNHINKTSNHVDFKDYRNEDAYLYKDKGAGHFTDFEHKIDARINSHSGNSLAYFWMVSNDVDDVNGLRLAGKSFLAAVIGFYGTSYYIQLNEFYLGTEYDSTYSSVSAGTTYYCTIKKSGTAFTCKIYSDSARTNLITTLSLTLHENTSKRYIFVCNTWNSGTAYYGDEDIENLDLQEAGDTTPPTYSNVGTNTTKAGQPCKFSVKWTDNVGLSGFKFGTNNTGTWVNDTWTDPWTGTPTSGWSNVTKTLTSTIHAVVQWRIWVNDTSNNWNNTGTQTLTTSGLFERQITETGSLQAVASRLQTFARTLAELFNLVASPTRTVTNIRQPFETVTLETFSSRMATLFRAPTMTSQVSTFTTAQKTVARLATLTLTPTAFAERILQSQRSTSQLLQLLATAQRSASFPRQATQNLILNIISTRTLTFLRNPTEILNIISQVIRQVTVTRTQPINVLIAAVTSQVSSYQRSIPQTINILSISSRSITFPRNPTETFSITFQTLRSIIAVRLQPQNIALTTLANRFATLPRTASQTVSVLVTSLRTLNLPRALSETVNIQAFSSTIRTFSRLQLQSISLIPSTIRTLSAQRQVFQPFSISSLASRLASLARTQIQQFTFVLSVGRTQTFARLASETITSQASAIRWQQLLRQAKDRKSVV